MFLVGTLNVALSSAACPASLCLASWTPHEGDFGEMLLQLEQAADVQDIAEDEEAVAVATSLLQQRTLLYLEDRGVHGATMEAEATGSMRPSTNSSDPATVSRKPRLAVLRPLAYPESVRPSPGPAERMANVSLLAWRSSVTFATKTARGVAELATSTWTVGGVIAMLLCFIGVMSICSCVVFFVIDGGNIGPTGPSKPSKAEVSRPRRSFLSAPSSGFLDMKRGSISSQVGLPLATTFPDALGTGAVTREATGRLSLPTRQLLQLTTGHGPAPVIGLGGYSVMALRLYPDAVRRCLEISSTCGDGPEVQAKVCPLPDPWLPEGEHVPAPLVPVILGRGGVVYGTMQRTAEGFWVHRPGQHTPALEICRVSSTMQSHNCLAEVRVGGGTRVASALLAASGSSIHTAADMDDQGKDAGPRRTASLEIILEPGADGVLMVACLVAVIVAAPDLMAKVESFTHRNELDDA